MKPASKPSWQHRQASDETDVTLLAEQTDLPETLLYALSHRGVKTCEEIERFLQGGLRHLPDPSLLLDLDRAVERLKCAIVQQERVAIHGDYDVDGISGTALLVTGLESMGAVVEYHIPHRLNEGYGLSGEAMRQARQNGCSVVVSVDCGISSLNEAKLAKEIGLDLIITDHHQPPDDLPLAYAVINPQRVDDPYPGKELAGVGVAFMLLIGLRRALKDPGHQPPDLRELLDLVTLGTIADVAPLTGVNRLMIKSGLERLNHLTPRIGLKALQQVAKVKQFSAGTIGFQLAPRLNAAGRLENAVQAVDLLLTSQPESAQQIAQSLDRLNRERQQIEQHTLEEAIEQVDALPEQSSIVLASEGWHPGVIGIVASRLVERYHRPAILISIEDGQGKGSARSVAGLDLHAAIAECQSHLVSFGGHKAAAGLRIQIDQLDTFKARFNQSVEQNWPLDQRQPVVHYDAHVGQNDLNPAFFEACSLCTPFGVGNAAPIFLLQKVQTSAVRILSNHHLKFSALMGDTSFSCIAFQQAADASLLHNPVDLLIQPEINHWQGRKTYQLSIKSIRPSA